MTLVDPALLPTVLAPSVLEGLAERLVSLGNTTITAMSDARDRWTVLGAGDVFDVTGAEAVPRMLDRPAADAREFGAALTAARNVLWDAATVTLPALVARRDELAARVIAVNERHAAAEGSWRSANALYVAERASDARDDLARERRNAWNELSDATSAGDDLRAEVARFRDDVDSDEQRIASSLRGIAGGTDVHGARGEPLRASQTFWGFIETPYPGAPAALMTQHTLAGRLTRDLGRAAESRIRWLAAAEDGGAAAWMNAHPDFASATSFVAPERAARLFDDLAAASRSAADGEWIAGPLAQLLVAAPLVIGNLNGAPATQRDLFNRAGLAQLFRRDDLTGDARRQLTDVQSRLVAAAPSGDAPSLLSLFLDPDGSPRASLAWGAVDTADQVTVTTHGIRTDLGSLGEWMNGSAEMKAALDEQLRHERSDATTAVILVMDWDSGGVASVFGVDLPNAGAARMSQTLAGVAQTNAGARLDIAAHSLGTTMTAQAVAAHPGLVDGVWFFGSAGVTETTGHALEQQIAQGTLSVHATHATADDVAGWGRLDWLSDHEVDPRTLDGVEEFGSDGDFVAGYGPAGERGLPTDSHDAHQSTRRQLNGWDVAIDGSPVPRYTEIVRTGYLDPTAESFKRLIVGLSDTLMSEEAR